MKIKKIPKSVITNELHLRNIFLNNAYLELGVIDTEVMFNLLEYKMVNINDITYFPVQNKGLGHSSLGTDLLKNYLPHLFYMQLARNNANYILYISYGLLKYRGVEQKESFMPIILIPIKLFYENLNAPVDDENELSSLNELYVQMIDTPIINPLLNMISGMPKINNLQECLVNLEGLDYILSQFDKVENYSVSLDNYITYAIKKINAVDLVRRKINQTKYKSTVGIDKLYRINSPIYISKVYDKEQRIFIERFANGENLTLTGLSGTGKTSVLKDIIVNNLGNNKKTLYISNSYETIKDVNLFLKTNNLDRYSVNFNNSFEMISNQSFNDLFLDDVPETNEYIKTLNAYYDELESYESEINKTLKDFHITEIIENYYESDRTYLNSGNRDYIDDLSQIYKHEYEIILHSIKSLERNTQNIDSFRNSIWNAIPIVNNIKHISEVLDIVRNLNNDFIRLRNLEIKLNEYGVKDAESFSDLKTLNEPLYTITNELIPVEWQKDINVFNKAIKKFKNISNDIQEYQNLLNEINSKFNNIFDLNINHEIELLHGDFYKVSNVRDINNLLEYKKDITKCIFESRICIDNFNVTSDELIKILNWDFLSKKEYSNIFIDLNNMFNKYYIHGKMINIILGNKIEDNIKELNYLYNNLVSLDNEMKALEKIEPRLSNLDFNKKIDYENEDFRNYDMKFKKSKKLSKEYSDLCGVNYKYHENNINAINAIKDFYEIIKSKSFRKTLIDYLQSIDNNRYIEFLTLSNILIKSYNSIENHINYFSNFGYNENYVSIRNEVNRYTEYLFYIDDLYLSNERVMSRIINLDLPYASVSKYYEIEDYTKKYNNKIKYFNNNTEYKELFGYLYDNESTNQDKLLEVANKYTSYINVFVNTESVYGSFEQYKELRKVVDATHDLLDSIVENIRQYSLIFKDSVSRYYYYRIEENVKYLTSLLNSKNELVMYLNITSEIGVLNDYKLVKMIKFIEENDDISNLSDIFKAEYFKELVKEYFKDKDYLLDTDNYLELLEKTRQLEDIVCTYRARRYINRIIKNNPVNNHHKKLNNYDYEGYLRLNSNHLKVYLCNLNFALTYSKFIDYDCVIIDDAHSINIGNISSLFKGKQFIVCGDYQANKTVTQNLISLISDIDVTLKNRYELGPRLLTNESYCKSPYLNTHDKNIGIEVLSKNISDYIFNLYSNDPNVKINYFIKNIDYQKQTYENITQTFCERNVNEYDILNFLTNNLFICDIKCLNYNKSDYNILYFNDYYNEDSLVSSSNIYSVLTLAHEKLVIYDDKHLLKENYDYDFFNRIKSITRSNPFTRKFADDLITKKITLEFNNSDYKLEFPGNGINFILEDKEGNIISVVNLFSNGNVTEILSNYRRFFEQYIVNNQKVIFTVLPDLIEKNDTYINKIIKKIKK